MIEWVKPKQFLYLRLVAIPSIFAYIDEKKLAILAAKQVIKKDIIPKY